MDENLLALLEKSWLFSIPHPDLYAQVEINPLEGFPFWMPGHFLNPERNSFDEQSKHFLYHLKSFLKTYLEKWTDITENDTSRPLIWKDFCAKSVSFFEGLDGEEIFHQLSESGKNTVVLDIHPNSSQITIRRLGDILALSAPCMKSCDKHHVSGRQAIELLLRDGRHPHDVYVFNLWRHVRVSLMLSGSRTENGNNEKDIDLEQMFEMIDKAMPYANWNVNLSALIESYKTISREWVTIGEYFNLPIKARLIHKNSRGKEDITSEEFAYSDRAQTWRIGNIHYLKESKCRFREAADLYLVLSLESSLPVSSYDKVDPDGKFHDEQRLLYNAGTIFSTSLGNMMLNESIRRDIELNKDSLGFNAECHR